MIELASINVVRIRASCLILVVLVLSVERANTDQRAVAPMVGVEIHKYYVINVSYSDIKVDFRFWLFWWRGREKLCLCVFVFIRLLMHMYLKNANF